MRFGSLAGAAPVASDFAPAGSLATSPTAIPFPSQSEGIVTVNLSRMYSPVRQRSLGKKPSPVGRIGERCIVAGAGSVGFHAGVVTGHTARRKRYAIGVRSL